MFEKRKKIIQHGINGRSFKTYIFENVMILKKISDSAPHLGMLTTFCDTRPLTCLHHIFSSVCWKQTNQMLDLPGMLMGILVENVLSLAMQTAPSKYCLFCN